MTMSEQESTTITKANTIEETEAMIESVVLETTIIRITTGVMATLTGRIDKIGLKRNSWKGR